MHPVVPSMGNTRFSRVGFWAKCYPEMEVRCQNARFRFMPCTEYGAAVRKKQGSCIHLPDGFGTGFPPNNSEKPFSGLPFPSFSRPKNVFHELCPFLCGEFFFAFKRLKNHSLEMEDAVHEDVGDIACVLYMMLSNTNGYFTDIKIKNQHLEQWEMTKEAVMEEALKNTCQMAPPLICTNDENKWGGSFMENGAFCLSKSDKVMGVRLSTNTKEYGAISVFYPGVLQRLAQLMGSDLYILFTSGNESTIYSANESNLEDIKTELNEMVIEYRNAMVFKCRNGMVFEEKLLSEELYYYSRIEDKISVYMEKVKVNFTTVNLKEVH